MTPRNAAGLHDRDLDTSWPSGPDIQPTARLRQGPITDARTARDLRIDLIRGFALLIILVDHISDAARELSAINAGHILTLRDLGWCSAAEFFVFLSGYVFGAVYIRTLDEEGFLACQKRALHRVWQIYRTNVLTFVASIAILALFTSLPDGSLQNYDLGLLYDDPANGFYYFLTLRYAPSYTNVLHLYVVLLLFAPPMLLLVTHRPVSAAVLSILLYITAQCFPWLNVGLVHARLQGDGMPSAWWFNPLAWQLLFFLSMALGTKGVLRHAGRAAPRRLGVWIGCGLLVIAFYKLVAISIRYHDPFGLEAYAGLFAAPATALETLQPLRLLYFLVMLYFAMLLIPPSEQLAGQRWAAPVIACGQNSLEIFCLGMVLTLGGGLLLCTLGGGYARYLLLEAAAVAATLLGGRMLVGLKRRPRTRTTSQG